MGVRLSLPQQGEQYGPGKHEGKVTDLYYDEESGQFCCLIRHISLQLAMTTPVMLEPNRDSVKILATTIMGWLFPEEAEALYSMAQLVPPGQAIVEIGSFHGRSTVCLGWGSRNGGRVPVYAVDPHTGSKEHQRFLAGSLGTLPHFSANMKRAGLQNTVQALVMTSEQAVDHVQEPVGLLFIDGDHESAQSDLELWYDKIGPGGKILFHDSVGGGWPKVETDVQTAVDRGLIQIMGTVGTITISRRRES